LVFGELVFDFLTFSLLFGLFLGISLEEETGGVFGEVKPQTAKPITTAPAAIPPAITQGNHFFSGEGRFCI